MGYSLCIFGPYTPASSIEGVTGIPGVVRNVHAIESRDDIDALLFIRAGRIAASVAHPRNRGDFDPQVVGKCYSKAQAVFSVRTLPGSNRSAIGPY
jgi:hypothetical protein